jgi:hypothetical protein
MLLFFAGLFTWGATWIVGVLWLLYMGLEKIAEELGKEYDRRKRANVLKNPRTWPERRI